MNGGIYSTGNEIVDENAKLNISGNIIPQVWYRTIIRESGKPNLTAIIILADIVYWYKPTEIRDEGTGQVIGVRKKFKSDLLQRSYQQISEQFGISKKEATNAVVFLEKLGVVKRVFRTISMNEEQAPTEQGYVRAEDVKFVVEETGDIQKVKMEDDHTKVSISKTDITDGKEIEGAKLQILDQDGEVVESWTTGEEHLIEYLPIGTYTLHEEAAVDGYIVANDVEFTVEETGEIQKVKMEDERAMGQLVIVKTDADSKAALEGVEFVLLEKETGKEVGRLKTGKDGKAVSELLPIGTYENGVFKEPITYVLKETATLKGYEKTEEEWEIVFTYQNDKTAVIEVVKEIQNKKIPETPGTVKPGPKTGDDTNWFLPLLALGVSAGMVAGLLYYRKRHKKA